MSDRAYAILHDGMVLWIGLICLSAVFYIPVAEPVYAGVLLLVSMALSWGFQNMMEE